MEVRGPVQVQVHEVIRRRRDALGITQAELAARAGLDARQLRRYESGESLPYLPAAKQLADALRISLDELAGGPSDRIDLTGDGWSCWQSWHDGVQVLNSHEVRMSQRGDVVSIAAVTRGTPVEGGGYLWSGEMRIVDAEAAIGSYVATEAGIRSKGSLYFALHTGSGMPALGRWVGMSHDGPLMSGWSALARTRADVVALVDALITTGPSATIAATIAATEISTEVSVEASVGGADPDGEEDL